MSKENLELKERKLRNIVWISTISIIGLWVLTYFLLKGLDFDERGTLGDMFGSINALFSGLALAGIIFSILLQQIELGYQREELKETRKEFTIQNQTLKKQRFETTFFNLIDVYFRALNALEYRSETGTTYKRSDVIAHLSYLWIERLDKRIKSRYKQIELGYIEINTIYQALDRETLRIWMRESYVQNFRSIEFKCGHYLRGIQNILEFVDESNLIKDDEKAFYASTFINQISNSELRLLYYHCHLGNELINLEKYQAKYDLLRNFGTEHLVNQYHSVIMND